MPGWPRPTALGLIHRDLKPANVFVAVRGGESDVAKVLDFGLVKLTNDPCGVELTSDQRVSGTPLYMSPEQAIGDRSLDARADIYALGCMMYFVLTGQPPFQAATGVRGDDGPRPRPRRAPVAAPARGARRPRTGRPAAAWPRRPDGRYPDVKALGKALAACAAATDWDAEKAQEWWAEVSQNGDGARLTSIAEPA